MGLDLTSCQTCLSEADVLKAQGNDLFRSRQWNEALVAYQSGLGQLPKRKERKPSGNVEDVGGFVDREEEKEEESAVDKGVATISEPPSPVQPSTPTEKDVFCAKARAVLNANIGACYVKLVCIRLP